MTDTNGKGVRIPGWAVSSIGIGVAVLLAGIKIGGQLQEISTNQRDLNYRLCRIETAMRIPRWSTCGPYDRAPVDGVRFEGSP